MNQGYFFQKIGQTFAPLEIGRSLFATDTRFEKIQN